ncbi:hypothetical protein VR44_20505 [Streptomyces katrae]|uniref:Uncharacterized protein n=1 Tax=Streptomyces katrae TaxID=68223 RepID=A0A0F4J9M3_9ACTN|nr:hypothetical protein VR44_20505 [Streptomyces katrae]
MSAWAATFRAASSVRPVVLSRRLPRMRVYSHSPPAARTAAIASAAASAVRARRLLTIVGPRQPSSVVVSPRQPPSAARR